MKNILFIIYCLVCISCDSQEKKTNNIVEKRIAYIEFKQKQVIRNHIIAKVVFSEINTSSPINNNFCERKVIEFSLDSISLVAKKYINERLIGSNNIKSYYNPNKEFFMKIPEKYLIDFSNKTYLNYYPENDGGYINVDIYMNNNKVVNWTLSYEENDLPDELKLVYKEFVISKKRFYR